MYPEVFSYDNELNKKDYLKQLTESFLYKDLLELKQIKNSAKIYDLLRLLAYQIGSPGSYNEPGRKLGLSTDTEPYTGAELDYIEQGSGKLWGFEIKWGEKAAKVPKSWVQHYPESKFDYINRKNYQDFTVL